MYGGEIPNIKCPVTQDSASLGLVESPPRGLSRHARGEVGGGRVGVQRGGALNRRRIADRSWVACGLALLVARLSRPNCHQLHLACSLASTNSFPNARKR